MNTSTSWSRIILSIIRLISYCYDVFEIVNDDQMHLWCDLFWRPSWCASTIPRASPNGGGPWLTRKPLDVATGWVFTLYCPSSRQVTANKTTIKKCTIIASRFDSRTDAPIQYGSPPNRGGPGLWLKSLVTTIERVLRPMIAIGRRYASFSQVFSLSTHYKKGSRWCQGP